MKDRDIIRDFFMSRLERDRDCEALYDYAEGRRYYYRDFHIRARKMANYLQDQAGVRKGDRVAICAGNCVEYVDLFYALVRTGMILTSYNVRLTERELEAMMVNEEPKVLFYEEAFSEKIHRIQGRMPKVLCIGLGNYQEEGDLGCTGDILSYTEEDRGFATLEFEDIAFLLHTGGTTGTPKGAMISYRALHYNVMNQIASYGISNQDVVYLCLPMFHAAAWNSLLMPVLHAGGRLVMTKKFAAEEAFCIMEEEKLTFLLGVPSIFQYMMEAPGFEPADFSGIGRIRCGAAPASLEMMKIYWKKGVRFCNGYGMTETGPGVLSIPINSMKVEDIERKQMSVGKPMIYTKLKIVDEKGREVPKGEKGELLIQSAALFSGYWNNREETEHVLRDGWMHSGDIAMQDEEGYYYIVGRKKNMFISHGENIYPVEIENVLLECRGIREVCVIGVPDKRKGEVGKAVIVPEQGSGITKDEIFAYIRKHLARIKQPKYVEIVDALPRNSVGKVLLAEVRERYGSGE